MAVKEIGENPLDEILNEGLDKPEVVVKEEVNHETDAVVLQERPKRAYKKRKRGRPKEGFKLYSVYMEPEMWAEMKWLAKRTGVKTRSALVRMLISRLSARIKAADFARETAEKNMREASPSPPPSGRPGD